MQQNFYANQHLRLFYSLLLGIILAGASICPLTVRAEGSKELSSHGGYRAYMYALSTPRADLAYISNTIKVYVAAGERLYIGSSAQGIGSGTINLRAPNGNSYTTGNSTTTGRISTHAQELAGPNDGSVAAGYTPYSRLVTAAEAGVWEIDFVSPSPTTNNGSPAILASADWTQASATCMIAAFDVSVKNTSGNFVTGRAFCNIFVGSMENGGLGFYGIFNVLTNDGYQYTVNNNGQAGYGFSFFSNNKGIKNADGTPSYRSSNTVDTTKVLLQDPRAVDTQTDFTHKLFFNTPSPDLPTQAATRSGNTWLLTTPVTPVASNFSFRGVEGTLNTAGTNPSGGNVSFTANKVANYALDIDCNRNGSFVDAIDRHITGSAAPGTVTVYWDGLDGQGNKVLGAGPGTNAVNMRVQLFGGEVHFPFTDVEQNPNGIIITRTNGLNQNDSVYWNDTTITANAVATPPNPRYTVQAVSSSTNGHKWGSSNGNIPNDWGDEKVLDTWTFTNGIPLYQTFNIVIRQSDLETVSITKSKSSFCVGDQVTYTYTMSNNGPDSTFGASAWLAYPTNLTGVTFGTPTVVSGNAGADSFVDSTYGSNKLRKYIVHMGNGAVMRFTLTGTVSTLPTNGQLVVQGAMLRQADNTDPDATNPDPAPPTDPQNECDAAPSGVGCNNVKNDSTVTTPIPTTAAAGSNQTLCNTTTATLAGNTPAAGTGAWSQVSGPNTATIAAPGAASTALNGLVAGTYVFRWTISSGSCTPSTSDVTVVIQPVLANNLLNNPASNTYCSTADPAVITGTTPTGGNGSYTYQWQQSADNSTFTNIAGATAASYDPPVITSTTYYRRQVTSGACAVNNSAAIVITVQAALSNNSITAPATTTFCVHGTAGTITGSAPAGGSGTYVYQWQSSADNATWTNINGATGQSYTPVDATQTTYYRRQVTSGACNAPAVSNVVAIVVNPALTSGSVASSQTLCGSGTPAPITENAAPSGGNGTYTYQWQSSVTSATSGFTNITGATSATYAPGNLTQTTYYQRVVTSSVCDPATSNVVIITVNPTLTAGAIGSDQTFCGNGNPAVFTQTTAPTGGNGTYAYQWQKSTTSATAGFTNINGATSITYDEVTIGTTSYYRRIVTSDNCSPATSNVITVTVTPSLTGNSIGTAQTICSGSTPTALTGSTPSGGSGTYTYQWQSAADGSTWSTATGTSTNIGYAPTALSNTTLYRRLVASGVCATNASASLTINVTPPTTTANAGPNQGPLNATTTTLAGNNPTQGTGTWTQVSGPNTASIVNTTQYNTAVNSLIPGTYVFRWTITNPPCAASSATVTIAVNTPPVTRNDSTSTNENTAVTISPLTNDSDPDGTLDNTSIAITTQPAHGTLQVNANGTVVYTPTNKYFGADIFYYTVKDNTGAVSNISSVKITVIQVNHPPVANNDQVNLNQDTQVTLSAPGILANDVDADGDQLSASVVSGPTHGTLTLNSDGSLTYTPTPGYFGTDQFTYQACDPYGACSNATVTFNVGHVNHPPTANADAYTLNEDGALHTNAPGVLGNDTDPDGDALTVTLVSGVSHGTLTLNADGSFDYVPDKLYHGTDQFTYKVCDASGACSNATVTLNVNHINHAPTAVTDNYTLAEDNVLSSSQGVLFNDQDVDGDNLSATLLASPAGGNITFNTNGSFTYTPNHNYNGIDSITYRVCDNGTPSRCDTAKAYFTITPVNDTAVAVNDSFTTNENVTLVVNAPGVLANDSDPDGDPITASGASNPAHGRVTLNSNGSFTYIPNTNYYGADAFTYQACDNSGACSTATVSITIPHVNQAPTAHSDNYTLPEDRPFTVPGPGVLANDNDPDNDQLTATIVTNPAHGTITLNPDGSFTYTPALYYNGPDQFTYKACDPSGLCSNATVTFNVTFVNHPPVAGDDTYSTNENTALNTPAPGVLANDNDVDNDPLTATVLTRPAHGSITQNADGSFVYTPVTYYHGPDSYTYTVCDNRGGCDTGTVNITVNFVNNPPIASNSRFTTNENTTLNTPAPGVRLNDYDPDGDALTTSLVTGPGHGTLTLNPNGSFTYVPATYFYGLDSFLYKDCDPAGLCSTATGYITVNHINQQPIAANDNYTTPGDQPITVPAPGVQANDSDPDGDVLNANLIAGTVNGTVTLNANGSLTYTPRLYFNGKDSLTYSVCDPQGLCDTAKAYFTVTPVNHPPHAANDNYTGTEDKPINITSNGVLFNDNDPDGNTLTAGVVTGPAHGNITLNPNGTFTYAPVLYYSGVDSVTYKACDPGGLCDTAKIYFTLNPVNHAPNAVADNLTLNENSTFTLAGPGLLGNDTDVDGDPLTASLVTGPKSGTITLNADGSLTYTPAQYFFGKDSIVYRVCDNGNPALCSTATAYFNVTHVNNAPQAQQDNYNALENTALVTTTPSLLFNDVDPDGDALAINTTPVVQPAHGTVAINADGTFTYVPNNLFSGTDYFTYQVCDPGGLCDSAIVAINVAHVNQKPIAADDNYITVENRTMPIAPPGLLANDTDPDGDPLQASVVTQPAHGMITVNNNGSFNYVPNLDYTGGDSFTYEACDNNGLCDTATANITVNAASPAIRARNDFYSFPPLLPSTITGAGILANDVTVADKNTLNISILKTASDGTFTLNAAGTNGSFTYMPNIGFIGIDSIVYQVCIGASPCSIATAYFETGSVNVAPVAVNDAYTMNQDTILTVPYTTGLLVNDSDPNTTLTDIGITTVSTPPAHGTVNLNVDGSFSYQPNPGYFGTDVFTYHNCDNGGLCASPDATVTITITHINHPPHAVRDTVSTNSDTPLTFDPRANDTDPDAGDVLTVTPIPGSGPNHGTITQNPDGTLTYTPSGNYGGTDVIQYQVCDNGTPSKCDTATIVVTVTKVNHPPVAVAHDYTTPEDTRIDQGAPGMMINDQDPDGDALQSTLVQAPKGTINLRPDGSFSYTPPAGFAGNDTLVYRDTDPTGLSDTALVIIHITAVNHAPVVMNDSTGVLENSSISGNVRLNDSDPDVTDTLTISLVTPPSNGTVVLHSDGSYTYTPNPYYNGTDAFSYQACDDGNPQLCNTANVTITVTGVNYPPVPQQDDYTMLENGTLNVPFSTGVLSNDSDPDNDPISANLLTAPLHGRLQFQNDGSFLYTPNNYYHGVDTFTYRVCDPYGLCTPATAFIHITHVNHAPIGYDSTFYTNENVPLVTNPQALLALVTEPDGDSLHFSYLQLPKHGSVTFNQTGSNTYTPDRNFTGTDSLIVQVCDPYGLCDTVVLKTVVLPVNNPPVTAPVYFTLNEDSTLHAAYPGILTADHDPDNDDIGATLVTGPKNGTVQLYPDGSFVYTPNPLFYGSDSIVYNACDVHGACTQGTAYITVQKVNTPPIARDDNYSTGEDTTLVINAPGILGNDSQANNDPLTATVLTQPAHGTVTVNANGSITYVPNQHFSGTDKFTYNACDALVANLCSNATVYITVNPVNDPPVATNEVYNIHEDSTITILTPGVLGNDYDPDGDPIAASLITPVQHGTLQLFGSGRFIYTPDLHYDGVDSFTYAVCDPFGLCTNAVAVINIIHVNHPPVAHDATFSNPENTPVTYDPVAGLGSAISDPDGDSLSISYLTSFKHGTVTVNGNGTNTYTPAQNYVGIDSIQYKVCDPGGLCDTAWVRIIITPVNQPPVAVDDHYGTLENQVLSINAPGLLANDSDPDGDALNVSILQNGKLGRLTVNADQSLTYVPNNFASGIDTITYVTCDAQYCDTALAIITIQEVNYPPVAVSKAYVTPQDSSIVISSLGGASDPDGNNITATITQQPAHGTLTLNGDSTYTYTPATGFFGTDYTLFSICDNGTPQLCDTGRLSIIVKQDTTEAPIKALNDSVTTTARTPVTGNVLLNDVDTKGHVLQASLTQAPAHGALVLNADGSFTYTPNSGFAGNDTAYYQACHTTTPPLCANAILIIKVTEPPLKVVNDTAQTAEDTPVSGNVLTNDVDAAGHTLSATVTQPPAHGSITLGTDGSYTYTPGTGFAGMDTVHYQACHNATPAQCADGILVIIVTEAPIKAVNDAVTTKAGTPVSGNVLSNDTDAASHTLTATLTQAPAHGSVTIGTDGSFTYTPVAGFAGNDTVHYQACHTATPPLCADAILVITVGEAPIQAVNDSVSTLTAVAVNGNVLANDVDAEGHALQATMTRGPAHGTINLNTDGSFTYTSEAGFTGTDTVHYQACHTATPPLCADAILVITVTAPEPPITALDDNASTAVNTPVSGNVLTNDTDVEGHALQATIVKAPVHGNITLNLDGSYTYTPNNNFIGFDTLHYQACHTTTPPRCADAILVIKVGNQPVIGIAKELTGSEQLARDGSFNLTYRITVRNMGTVPLSNIQVTDALTTTFPAPATINVSEPIRAGHHLTANRSFNGSDDIALVNGGQLDAGTEDTVTFTVNVNPHGKYGQFGNYAVGGGEYAGAITTDTSTSGANPDPDGDGIPSEDSPTTSDLNSQPLKIPNVFTPNGDGKNETFVIPGIENYPGSQLYIFNRWGNEVYRSENYDNAWNGSRLNEGTYYYLLYLKSGTGTQVMKGWVEIIR